MQSSQVVIFEKDNIKEVLTQFGFKTQLKKTGKKNKEMVLGQDNQFVHCPSCEKEISVKKVGTIAHGSRIIFCDNPLCFAIWVAKNKIA